MTRFKLFRSFPSFLGLLIASVLVAIVVSVITAGFFSNPALPYEFNDIHFQPSYPVTLEPR